MRAATRLGKVKPSPKLDRQPNDMAPKIVDEEKNNFVMLTQCMPWIAEVLKWLVLMCGSESWMLKNSDLK